MSEASPQAHSNGNGANPRNRILASLPAEEWARLREMMEFVPLEIRHTVFEPNQPIENVYFVEHGVVSILGLLDDGSAVETATVGHEGMAGIPVFLGAMQMSGQAFAQVPGDAWRMPSAALREEVRRRTPLADLLGRYTQALFTLVAQSSACNRRHGIEERCARWLLMTHDRVGQDTFELTQLFLSQMLGVRRATVSEAAAGLQERGLIEYRRGVITVLDREGLERASCGCYRIIAAEFERMLEGRVVRTALDEMLSSEDGRTIAGPGMPDEPGDPQD